MVSFYSDNPPPARPRAGRSSFRLTAALASLAVLTALLPAMKRASVGPVAEPAATPVLGFGEAELSTGIRMHYAEQGDAAGEAVILLHGYSDSWFSWSRVLPLFPASWHVYALDQRGHGDTDRPGSGYAMRDLAADALAFMDAKGLRKATIVGHSMGGLVAQQVAATAPERVTRLVLVATARELREFNGVAEFEQVVMALTDPVPEPFARDFQVSTIHRTLPPAFVDRTVVESLKLPARVWHALMRGMASTPPVDIPGGRFQTLICWGIDDAFVSRAAAEHLQTGIPGARLMVYPETGHAVHWERPEDFAEDLRDFVTPPRR